MATNKEIEKIFERFRVDTSRWEEGEIYCDLHEVLWLKISLCSEYIRYKKKDGKYYTAYKGESGETEVNEDELDEKVWIPFDIAKQLVNIGYDEKGGFKD